MKLFLAVCLVAVASATSSNMLEAFKRAAGFDEIPSPRPEGPECKSTILAGLPAHFIEVPKMLTKEEIEWLLKPVAMKDLEGMKEYVMKVGRDMMDIAIGFEIKFAFADFADFNQLRHALEMFFVEVIMPKEIDMEGVKDLVDGMLVRSVMSGTKIPELGEMNEAGCINLESEYKDPAELACLMVKFELLEKAIEIAQMMSFQALYDAPEQMKWCDSVFRLMENPTNVTANGLVDAMMELGECFFANRALIEERLNPNQPGPDGKAVVPELPIPRLIALSVKMQAYEHMGMVGYESFQIVEGFIRHMARRNDTMMPVDIADMPKMDMVRQTMDGLKEAAADMKKGKGKGGVMKKCKKVKAIKKFMEKMGKEGKKMLKGKIMQALKNRMEDMSGMGPDMMDRMSGMGPELRDRMSGMGPEFRDRMSDMGPDMMDRMSGMGPEFRDRMSGMGPEFRDRMSDMGPRKMRKMGKKMMKKVGKND